MSLPKGDPELPSANDQRRAAKAQDSASKRKDIWSGIPLVTIFLAYLSIKASTSPHYVFSASWWRTSGAIRKSQMERKKRLITYIMSINAEDGESSAFRNPAT
jgi:hypothetical protein